MRGRTAGLLLLLAAACRRETPPPVAPAEFVIGAPYELTSLDPHLANTVSNYSILANVYEPLVTSDAEGRLQPALAESWENPDRLTWVLHLRRGVTFHSGRPLRAPDVVYSLRRLMTDPRLEMGGFVQLLVAVDAVGERTVRLRTRQPTRILLNKLRFATIVPEGATTEGLDHQADGTGPYRVEAWTRGRGVALRRYAGYWARPPALEQVRFQLAPARDLAEGVRVGHLQLALGGPVVEQAAQARADRYQVLVHDNIYVKYLGWDLRETTPFCAVRPNPFRRLEVRRAVDLAVDRAALAAAVGGHAAPAAQPVPRVIFGFDPALAASRPDLDRARVLLRQAGQGGGFSATLHARAMFEPAARAVAAQLARVGIRLEVEAVPDEAFFAQEARREHTLWLTRYGCPTGDGSDVLENVIHSADPARHLGAQNVAGFADPALDRAIDGSAQVEEMDERRQAMQQLMGAVMEQLPVLPLYTDQDIYALDRGYAWQPRNDSYLLAAEIRPRAAPER